MPILQPVIRTLVAFCCVALFLASASYAETGKDKKRRELLEKIDQLRQEKEVLKQTERKKISKLDEKSSESRQESIRLFERLVATTQRGDVRRCDAFSQLGALYYEQESDDYIQGQNKYQTLMTAFEKSGGLGAAPVEPLPKFDRSLNAFNSLVLECTDSKSRDVVLYKLGNIYTALGEFEKAFEAFTQLIKEFPNSENVPFAHLRIGEYYYINRDNDNALKHYEAVGLSSGSENYLLSLYRIASCYYNLSQFDKAIDRFFEYVEMADSGKFKKADFRDEALEYLAISFSEESGGAENAMKFFKEKGGRSYQDFIIYTIGIKNRDHDNVKEAVKSLGFLLDNYPLYINAPIALKALTDCYVIEKDYNRANELRERMSREYGPGSAWDKANAGANPQLVETTRGYIKEAAATIPIYFHKLGNVLRDSGKADRAVPYYLKALTAYDDYIKKYPNEKWNCFTFHYFRADLLSDSLIARYDEAAREFDWVSREDTTRYPSRSEDSKKVLEEKRKQARDIKDQFHSDIKEQVQSVQVNPEEAAFAAVVCYERISKKALKAKGFTDTTAYQGYQLPEMQTYLKGIRDFRGRFPQSKHAAEVAFLESNIYFDAKNFIKAIEGYKFVVQNFQSSEVVYKPSLENLGKAYLKNEQYEEAIAIDKRLMAEYAVTAKDKTEMIETIAAAMFQIADQRQKKGDYSGAADEFKQIVIDYPDFSKCDVSLYNAANSYEQGGLLVDAGKAFERVYDKYPKSKWGKQALLRSAAAYQKARDFENAAAMFLKFVKEMPTDSGAVPCLFRAAFMYDSLENTLLTAKLYEEKIFECYLESKKDKAKYPGIEKETPGALYNAGLIYEKAKQYDKAIAVYQKLDREFPASQFTSEANFSIAICYEKTGNDAKIAESYLDFVKKYGADKQRVVHSLMKAAEAYRHLNRRSDEEKMFRTIIDIHKEFGDKFNIDPKYAAECYFTLGQRAFDEYVLLDLRTEKRGKTGIAEVEKKLKAKVEATKAPLGYLTDCIGLKTDEWTTRATWMCGELFWNLLEVVKNQPILETDASKAAYAKVKVNEALPPYFEKVMNYYFINVNKFGNEMGVKNEWIKQSAERYAQAWYLMGYSHVENGDIFGAAPNPYPKGTEEFDVYKEKLDGIIKQLTIKSIPVFANGIMSCSEIYVNNTWVERMRKELQRQDPENEALKVVAKEPPKSVTHTHVAFQSIEKAYERSLKQIQNTVLDNGMQALQKIEILTGIEISAKREIDKLREEIAKLKAAR
ncbi:MAG: tetratricopeptide repeat protein [Fibrobacterota bacterium]